jgi:hypothetical protein
MVYHAMIHMMTHAIRITFLQLYIADASKEINNRRIKTIVDRGKGKREKETNEHTTGE